MDRFVDGGSVALSERKAGKTKSVEIVFSVHDGEDYRAVLDKAVTAVTKRVAQPR